MIAHECSPGLPTDAFWASLPHILLDGPFTHANIQFEKFATDTLCSPESVVGCHLLNQGNRLGRKLWLSYTRLRFAFPEEMKKLPMPAQERLWLDKEEGLFPSSDHPCQEHQQKPVCPFAHRALDLSAQNDELLPQQCVFRQQFGFASSRIGERAEYKRSRQWFDPTRNTLLEPMQTETDSLLKRRKYIQH